jgi:hypothetical protein
MDFCDDFDLINGNLIRKIWGGGIGGMGGNFGLFVDERCYVVG